ncbi:MAG: hypothetical protein HFJ08_14305 [Lachnospiraceae bacterium]|nr:hypothetical protein [Lachnospiraceae bacterium]MCI9400830.1 hypothetical protein [Lachnospiraceae bacterium]
MNNQYACDIIKDLMPGYIDGILSETGNSAVEGHLKECKQCSKCYKEMKESLESEGQITLQEKAAVDGFQKINKRTKVLKAAVCIVSGVLLLLIGTIFLKIYVFGSILGVGYMNCSNYTYYEETDSLTLEMEVFQAVSHISHVSWKENSKEENRIDVSVYLAEALPFQKEEKQFSITIPNVKGKKVYLVGGDYEQQEVYNWYKDHNELFLEIQQEIYQRIPQLNIEKNPLRWGYGIETVDGIEGVRFCVDYIVGENAVYWGVGDEICTNGAFEPAEFDIWVSLEKPHKIQIYDYHTGEYTEDFSIIP